LRHTSSSSSNCAKPVHLGEENSRGEHEADAALLFAGRSVGGEDVSVNM